MRKIVFTASILLLIILLTIWWLMIFSSLSIPLVIPHTPFPTVGLILIATMVAIYTISFKRLIKIKPDINTYKLSCIGCFIWLIPESIYQFINQVTIPGNNFSNGIYYFLYGTIGTTAMATIIAFFVAFQLKTQRTKTLIFLIFTFLSLLRLLGYFFSSLIE